MANPILNILILVLGVKANFPDISDHRGQSAVDQDVSANGK